MEEEFKWELGLDLNKESVLKVVNNMNWVQMLKGFIFDILLILDVVGFYFFEELLQFGVYDFNKMGFML